MYLYSHLFVFISGNIQIRQKDEGIALHAPNHGLQEVSLNANALKVREVNWIVWLF